MFKGKLSDEMPTGEFQHVSLQETTKLPQPEEEDFRFPQIPDREDVHEPSDPDKTITTNFRRPVVATAELPEIPEKLITGDVQRQAKLVIGDLIGDGESEDFIVEQDKEREVHLRNRIIIQLERVTGFLSKLRKAHSNCVPSLTDEFLTYQRTVAANISSLGNKDIKTRDVVTNMSKFVIPQLITLRNQFKSHEDKNFSFDEVRDLIKECLEILAHMEKNKS